MNQAHWSPKSSCSNSNQSCVCFPQSTSVTTFLKLEISWLYKPPTTRIHTSSQPNNKNRGQEARSSERQTSFSLDPGNRNLQWYEEAKPKGSNTSEFGYLSKPGLLTGGTKVVVSFQYTETWEACAVCAIYLLNTSYCLHSDRWKSQRTLKCAKLDRSIVKLLLFWADTAVLLASRSWCLRTV